MTETSDAEGREDALRPGRSASGRVIPTRTLLVSAAFGAIGALLLVLLAPVAATIAVLSPPLYAAVAGVDSVVPFLARRVLGYPAAATAVAVFVAILAAPVNPIGYLILVPFAVSGAAYDLSLALLRRLSPASVAAEWHFAVAAGVSAVALFLVSLPVMSPQHVAAPVLVATLAGRLAGQSVASFAAGKLASRLRRAGVIRIDRP